MPLISCQIQTAAPGQYRPQAGGQRLPAVLSWRKDGGDRGRASATLWAGLAGPTERARPASKPAAPTGKTAYSAHASIPTGAWFVLEPH